MRRAGMGRDTRRRGERTKRENVVCGGRGWDMEGYEETVKAKTRGGRGCIWGERGIGEGLPRAIERRLGVGMW